MLFQHKIDNLEMWGNVFQSIHAFKPLIRFIFLKHNLVFSQIENCTPGSNAVFKVGNYVIKIFAPDESQIGGVIDYKTEQFGITRANKLALKAPKLFAYGEIKDTYIFRYLIMEYIDAKSLDKCNHELSNEEKENVAQKLGDFTTKMDIKCERFNSHELFSESAEERWKNFSVEFQNQRKEYLSKARKKNEVYIHGDLNRDNILLMNKNEIRVIDFSDALLAPIEFEYACLICDAFQFDQSYIKGFFGEYNKEELVEMCTYGLLIHDFGFNIIRDSFGNVELINGISHLEQMIFERL